MERVRLSEKRRRELARFLRRLRDTMNVREVYIFESRVYGEPLRESDLDIIVVSEEFGGRSFVENMEAVSRLWDGSFTIEVFPLHSGAAQEVHEEEERRGRGG